jgi:serine/threonine-protein kinase
VSAVATAAGLPARLGKYEILTQLASGGMARIYVARTTGIGAFERHVVLKVISPERAQDFTSVQMFLDEARLAASLNHQNVAQVFEVGEEAGIHFLAMEYVHGQDLRALLAKAGTVGTRVPLDLALTIVAGAAAGLDHAHERRNPDGTPMAIVHRDVSPSNIMMGYDGSVKLLDFGIAKAAARSVETQSGIIKGKFAYMAPEQCRGREVDRRSDVFSLGIILYEVTTQHRCFRADSDFDTMHRIVTGDIVRPTRLVHGYPPALETIVMKALTLDLGQRYQSAGQLLEAIEGFAAVARLSLSTVALGRFLRDMFGDIPEPWLQTGDFHRIAPPREHTISNTSAPGQPAAPRSASSASSPALQRPSAPALPPPPLPGEPLLPPALSAVPPPTGQRASVSSLSSLALQRPSPLPGVPPQHHDHAPLHLPPDLPLELPIGPASPGWRPGGVPSDPAGAPDPTGMTPAPVAVTALATELYPGALPGPPPGPGMPALGRHGSSEASAPAYPAMPRVPHGTAPIARTRQGYDHAPGHAPGHAPPISRSEPAPRFAAHELEGNISLQPSHRLLYVGIGVALVGIIVLLAISIADNREESATARSASSQVAAGGGAPGPASVGGAAAGKPETGKPDAVRNDSTVPPASSDPAGGRATIHLHVVSTPPSAEVSLSGKPLGVTPLELDLERRTGSEPLTIHRARYQDVTVAVDLGRDYEQTVALVPVPDAGAARTPGAGTAPTGGGSPGFTTERDGRKPPADRDSRPTRSTDRDRDGGKRTQSLPPREDCQPPDKINPYEKACHGHVCKPCSP